MNKLDLLYDVLTDKMWSQNFYNAQMLLMLNVASQIKFHCISNKNSQLNLHKYTGYKKYTGLLSPVTWKKSTPYPYVR